MLPEIHWFSIEKGEILLSLFSRALPSACIQTA
jgi:hypothetical protein